MTILYQECGMYCVLPLVTIKKKMSSDDHSKSVFTNASIRSSPVLQSNSAPYVLESKHRPRGDDDLDPCASLRIHQATLTPRSEDPQASVKPSNSDYAFLFKTLLESNSLLRKEISSLQKNHRETLSTLRRFCDQNEAAKRNELYHTTDKADRGHMRYGSCQKEEALPYARSVSHVTPSQLDSEITPDEISTRVEQGRDIYASVEEISPVSYNRDRENSHDEYDNISVQSIESLQSSVDSSSLESLKHSGFASPGAITVGKMWDNFSVDDYDDLKEKEDDSTRKSLKWEPRITIPQPFSMTIREATTPKKKSRTRMMVEREAIEREAAEEAELGKQFRAIPIPASTFLPLYELMNAKNEQKREHSKRLNESVLQSSQKPFTFTERDEERIQQKSEYQKQNEELEKDKMLRERDFKARPIPERLFDPEVDEMIQEQEEYRKIRKKMRAEELCKKSRICGSAKMRESWDKYRTRGAHRQEKKVESANQYSFHPKISHKIPDYDRAFFRLQQELVIRKNSKPATSTEPFHLHTEEISSKRAKSIEGRTIKENPKPMVPCKSPRKSSQAVYPTQTTETSRVRRSLTEQKLAEIYQKAIMEEDERRMKREKEKELHKMVIRKSMDQDPTSWIRENSKKKLQQSRLV